MEGVWGDLFRKRSLLGSERPLRRREDVSKGDLIGSPKVTLKVLANIPSNKCHASSNRCLNSSNKKLVKLSLT